VLLLPLFVLHSLNHWFVNLGCALVGCRTGNARVLGAPSLVALSACLIQIQCAPLQFGGGLDQGPCRLICGCDHPYCGGEGLNIGILIVLGYTWQGASLARSKDEQIGLKAWP